MSPDIRNDRWAISADQFAVRIMIPDLSGFFKGACLMRPQIQCDVSTHFPPSRACVREGLTGNAAVPQPIYMTPSEGIHPT